MGSLVALVVVVVIAHLQLTGQAFQDVVDAIVVIENVVDGFSDCLLKPFI